MFSRLTIESLKSYVYTLKDITSNRVFYVGKGEGNRVYNHITQAFDDPNNNSDKCDEIRRIGKEISNMILYDMGWTLIPLLKLKEL